MTARTCNHIMPDGHTCGSPALRHQEFCYFHNEQRKRKSRIKVASCPYFPRIPMHPTVSPECPAVVAARLGILSNKCSCFQPRAG